MAKMLICSKHHVSRIMVGGSMLWVSDSHPGGSWITSHPAAIIKDDERV